MKFVVLVAMLFFAIAAYGQIDFNNPVAYNTFIVDQQRKVVEQNLNYISFSIHSADYPRIEAKRKAVLKQIMQAKAQIDDMPAFKGSNRLKNEAIDLLIEYQAAFEEDYREAIKLSKVKENSFEAMEAYFDVQNKIEERVKRATLKFNEVQNRFVKQHNLTFGKGESTDDLTNRMKHIVALNQYVRGVFLEYFRASKAFAQMLEVLPQQKSGPLNKKRKQVIDVANHTITVLNSFEAFNGESDYLDQTVNLIEFYKKLAENEFLKITTIFDKKHGMSQQDVDFINKVLLDYQTNMEMLLYNINTANNSLLQNNIASTQ